MGFSVEELQKHNSELLKLLTKHLPDMLWVKDLEGNYLYANQAICDNLLMAKDTQEPIGKGDVFFALRERETHKNNPQWHTFGELCFNSDQEVIDNQAPMRFEEYGNVKGKLLYLEVYKAPFYDKQGNVVGTVGTGRDITELKMMQLSLEKSLKKTQEQKEQLQFQATHDSLTNLPNRILLIEKLKEAIQTAQKNIKQAVLLTLDLDHFKEINDSLGHIFGDIVLVEFANRLKEKIAPDDTLARLGGDEFCIILNHIESTEEITNYITDIMMMLKKPFLIENSTLYLGVSVGISIFPNNGQNDDTLLRNSDAAMNKAKSNGRHTYCFYNEQMTQQAYNRVFLESALRDALENDEFVVHFQPQIDAMENRLVGMETLVRWNHPSLGLIAPDKFIPLAELTGMIVYLDRIVMQKALKQFQKWHKEGLNPGKLSMNLAMKQIEEDDFIDFLKILLIQYHDVANKIEFEVTESQIMKNPEQSIKTLSQINQLGISIAIDDFGTGYSSLAYLKKLPIHKLKIDKSFVKDLPSDQEDAAISKTIINLCTSLNLKVIAEGVETLEQKDFLLSQGCRYIQGFFYSQAINAQEMTDYLIQNQ